MSSATAKAQAEAEKRKQAAEAEKKWRRCRDDVELIIERAKEPIVPLTLGEHELAKLRAGSIALLIGGTGGGKTSLALSLAIEHAARRGPAIAMSLELPVDELSGRAIGIGANATWFDVLDAKLSVGSMLSAVPERLMRIPREHGSLAVLAAAIADMRSTYPGEPVLVAVDYVQLVGANSDEDVRPRVGRVMRDLDEVIRAGLAACIALSQGSRASSRGLSRGDLVGSETADAGAEASDLERWASLTLAIGAKQKSEGTSDDGIARTEIHIGKYRFGRGDRVVPARFHGASGRWEIVGEAKPADEVKAERAEQRDAAAVERAALTIMGFVAKSTAPLTRTDLEKAAGLKATFGRAAVTRLLESGDLVELKQRRPRSSKWLIWTADKARAEGIPLAGDGGGL